MRASARLCDDRPRPACRPARSRSRLPQARSRPVRPAGPAADDRQPRLLTRSALGTVSSNRRFIPCVPAWRADGNHDERRYFRSRLLALSLEGRIEHQLGNPRGRYRRPYAAASAARRGAAWRRLGATDGSIAAVVRDRRWPARAGSISGILSGNAAPQAGTCWSWVGALCRPAAIALSPGFHPVRSHRTHVERDGACDDAAERGADDPDLRRNRRHRGAQGRARGFTVCARRSVTPRSGSVSHCSRPRCRSALARRRTECAERIGCGQPRIGGSSSSSPGSISFPR